MNLPTFIQKYKPYYVDDFFLTPDQNTVLKHMLNNNIVLNLMVVGDVATGKTTFLYALIREYYGLTRTDRFSQHDVLFINNLKEQQGIGYFRNEMKTFCQTRSKHPQGHKKMIVIDDVDTIHQQCQQVLCNYIDKYRHNIHFVFSCNNVQKVTENIQSRIQILRLGTPEPQHLLQLYNRIVQEEGLDKRMCLEEKESIRNYLLSISHGNLRELVNILEKMIVFFGNPKPNDVITEDLCRSLFLTRIHQSFQDYLAAMRQNDLRESIRIMYSIVANGYSMVDIFDAFFKFVKITDLVSEKEKYEIVKILCNYITIIHNVHEETIEMVLFTNDVLKIMN